MRTPTTATKRPEAQREFRHGDNVYVYGAGYGRVNGDPYRTPIEIVFGHPDDTHRVVDVVIYETGEILRRATTTVVLSVDAQKALHALDTESRVVAGGPGADEDKVRQLAAERDLLLVRGIPISVQH